MVGRRLVVWTDGSDPPLWVPEASVFTSLKKRLIILFLADLLSWSTLL